MTQESSPARRVQLAGRRRTLVRNMEASLSVPTATTMRTFDVAALDAHLANASRAKRPSVGVVLAYAVVWASLEVPAICSRYEEIDKKPLLVVDGATHLGIAVDVPEENNERIVMVPTVRNASSLGYGMFADSYVDLVTRARDKRLEVSDLQMPNLIVTSTASFGSTTGVPRLPAGIGAIVALGTITYPPGFARFPEKHLLDRIMTASCTYDHRVVQGGDSGQFLAALENTIANPSFYAAIENNVVPQPKEHS